MTVALSAAAAVAAIGTAVPCEYTAPGAGLVSTVIGGWCAPTHVVPLIAKEVGAVFVPLYVNWAPVVTAAPTAIAPFQDAFFAVTALPDCDQVPLQPLVSVWLPA